MEELEELGPMSQGVFLPERVHEGLHTSRPEVGAKADRGQVGEIGKEFLEILGEMYRIPRELEDEINKIVETVEKPNERENEWGVDWRGHEGMVGVEGDTDAEL